MNRYSLWTMRLAILFLALAGCSGSTSETPPTDAGNDVTIPDARTEDSQPIPWDQSGYPCGALTTYPFDGGGSLDASDDGGLSLPQCQLLCAGAPGPGICSCYIGDAGTALVCQACDCG
jgi:hypothetical protein